MLRILGAQVVLPDGIEHTDVWIDDGIIVGIGQVPETEEKDCQTLDGRGRVLAPAMIDVHGDAFERQMMPRPGVMFPLDGALLETDRQLAGNGVATAYHAMTISWEPGLRSEAMARQFVATCEQLASRLVIDHRMQLRWETFAIEAVDFVRERLLAEPKPALAFNDHTSTSLLHPDVAVQERPFEHDEGYPVADHAAGKFRGSMGSMAARCKLTEEEYIARLLEVWSRKAQVPEQIAQLARLAKVQGVPMLSHDDSQVRTRQFYREHGSRLSEFPMQVAVAEEATQQGDWVVFGAPNVV